MRARPERYALLSVSDKHGIEALAEALLNAGVGLLSTGGTAAALRGAGLPVTDVAEHTGAAEMMAGRVKTLHPTIHGGILGRRGIDDAVMEERGIPPIDYVIVNLYPFADTVARVDVTFDEAIENIDIGGPAMVRAAAKNHAAVMVVTDPDDYDRVIASLDDADGAQRLRFDLAVKAFEHTARYDGMIANYLGRCDAVEHTVSERFPRTFNCQFELIETLRYGENPHQQAALYRDHRPASGTLAAARLLQGKPLSYNNVMDADAALGCVTRFSECACVIVKHANPCGVALGTTPLDAYEAAWRTDRTSAFGGIIAFNRPLDASTVRSILERQFVEVIVAPGFDAAARSALGTSANVRVLVVGTRSDLTDRSDWQLRRISGGLLVQEPDQAVVSRESLRTVTERPPTEAELEDLVFAWQVARHVKSNAIVYARNRATIGVGAGQMSRVYSARIAAIKAADEALDVTGAVMASDAFFPFRDGIDSAAEVGIAAVIQPGGSRRDDEVIAAADEHGIAMVFTGIRHFLH